MVGKELDRFVILDSDDCVVRDRAEGNNFRLENKETAKELCEVLKSMHNTLGILLEELEGVKFPIKHNTEFDAQELFGEKDTENG